MQVGIGHFVQRRQCGGTGNRVARIGTAQSALGQCVEQRLASDHRAQWHAAANALAEQDQVRFDAQPWKRKALTGAAKPGLDFIGDQHNVLFIAQTAQRLCELDVQCEETGLTLHRFDDETGHVFDIDFDAEQSIQRLQRLGAAHTVVLAREGQVIHRAG
ncbi:hypothetical protein D3C73_819440 [compost metagenome]